MRKFLTLTAAYFLVLLQAAPSHAQWCGKSDEALFDDLGSMLWAGSPPSGERPYIYTMAAPWCPYCTQLFKTFQSDRYSFDIRYFEIWPTGDVHRNQIADAALNGTNSALARIYLQRKFSRDGISDAQRSLANEVQEILSIVIDERYRDRFSQPKMASPTSIALLDGKIVVIEGTPNLQALERLSGSMRRHGRDDRLSGLVRAGIPSEVPAPDAYYAVRDNVEIRILPDEKAVGAICLKYTQGLRFDGIVTVSGREWLVTRPFRPDTSLRLYALKDDFVSATVLDQQKQ